MMKTCALLSEIYHDLEEIKKRDISQTEVFSR